MVFIDAEHTYDALSKDLRAWYRTVKPGGVIACHDYKGRLDKLTEKIGDPNVGWGITRACHEFAEEHGLKHQGKRWIWWTHKCNASS